MRPPKSEHNTKIDKKSVDLSHYIIYEDQNIVVLDKPAGLLSVPDGYNPDLPNLRDLLSNRYGKIWVIHRLDKDTSGVILYAKHSEAHRHLNFAFSSRRVRKTYIALMFGVPFWEEKTVTYPLRVNGDRRHRTVFDLENGKPAETHITIQDKNKVFSMAEIQPKTGLTHQIRAHVSMLGHPILGDRLYSFLR